jgi:hypothetical protein
MEVDPLPSKSVLAATTIKLCKKSCKADPACQFYLFAKREKSCKLYSKRTMQCAGYLGLPKTAQLECQKASKNESKALVRQAIFTSNIAIKR